MQVTLESNEPDKLGRPLATAKDSDGNVLATFLMDFTAHDITLSMLCFGRSYSITLDKLSQMTIESAIENLLNQVNMTRKHREQAELES